MLYTIDSLMLYSIIHSLILYTVIHSPILSCTHLGYTLTLTIHYTLTYTLLYYTILYYTLTYIIIHSLIIYTIIHSLILYPIIPSLILFTLSHYTLHIPFKYIIHPPLTHDLTPHIIIHPPTTHASHTPTPLTLIEPTSLLDDLTFAFDPVAFEAIGKDQSPQERMVCVVQMFISGLYKAFLPSRKPFNPVLGMFYFVRWCVVFIFKGDALYFILKSFSRVMRSISFQGWCVLSHFKGDALYFILKGDALYFIFKGDALYFIFKGDAFMLSHLPHSQMSWCCHIYFLYVVMLIYVVYHTLHYRFRF